MTTTSKMLDIYQRSYAREAVDAIKYINDNVLTIIPAPNGIEGEGILFGIVCKETLWGTSVYCVPQGQECVGDNGNGFGLGQVDKRWHKQHTQSGDYKIPHKHFMYMAELLRQQAVYIVRNSPAGSADLKALIAAYNAGQGAVSKALREGKDPDRVTTGGNYATKVLEYVKEYYRLEKVPTSELDVVFDSLRLTAETAPGSTEIFKRYDTERIRDVFTGFLQRASQDKVFAVEEHQLEAVLAMRAIWSDGTIEDAIDLFKKELDDKNKIVPEGSEFVRPVTANYKVTSPYGYRTHPISGGRKFHGGIDYGAPLNAPIFAIADGVCTYSGYDSGYGFMVVIYHNKYKMFSIYTHNSKNLVSTNNKVTKGQKVAAIGSTGASTGPHLHFELRKANAPTNAEYFKNKHFNPVTLDTIFA